MIVPDRLAAACRGASERMAWLDRLPGTIRELHDRWLLSLGAPYDGSDVSCAWVAPAVRRGGTSAVLKIGIPHLEGVHEIEGLRFWDGEPTVRLLDADADLNAMLLERCEPGAPLRDVLEPEQDVIVAGLLRRLWRRPADPHPFRPLSVMTAHWAEQTMAASHKWPDSGLARDGLQLMDDLSRPSVDDVLLGTDLHAGNVLRARREPWLVIDPKPFVGDRAYDATQHLLNCKERMLSAPAATIRRFADLLEVDDGRVRLWMFARLATGLDDMSPDDDVALARALA